GRAAWGPWNPGDSFGSAGSGVLAAQLGVELRALLLIELDLADADRGRGDLDAFVLASELEALFESELARRGEILEAVGRCRTHVRLLLLLRDVDVHVVGPRVLADDLALVDLGGRFDEEGAPVLQVDHRIGGHGSGAVGDERAVDAEFDVAGPGTVSGGDRVRD